MRDSVGSADCNRSLQLSPDVVRCQWYLHGIHCMKTRHIGKFQNTSAMSCSPCIYHGTEAKSECTHLLAVRHHVLLAALSVEPTVGGV
eukprot:921232-Amphidinium_carterae.1